MKVTRGEGIKVFALKNTQANQCWTLACQAELRYWYFGASNAFDLQVFAWFSSSTISMRLIQDQSPTDRGPRDHTCPSYKARKEQFISTLKQSLLDVVSITPWKRNS